MSQDSVVAKIKTIGLDLGDRFSQVCGLFEDGTIGVEDKVASRKEALRLYFRRFTSLRAVCEVGTHSPWVKPLLESLGHAVLVGKLCGTAASDVPCSSEAKLIRNDAT
jgi:hypothetical protein